ncbi:hypothetical protein PSACC_00137 [Paramicrosporidium saccamoebae]|uniref:Uncharacterized protein n=1 Tax=Paramicrosporidium saccamoebae TaxID=1246581 RepID=A0A2H9TQN1_9FUNG|nr:hypothetical protein PSACC_00137 [Paramicrosporidium saccamoebae]
MRDINRFRLMHPVHANIYLGAAIPELSAGAPFFISVFMTLKIDHPDRLLDWVLICSVAPYVILLAILKYRAAYHRKLCKRQSIESRTQQGISLWAYLKEIFRSEAKMSPTKSPILSCYPSALYYLVFWILYPRPITSCQLHLAYVFACFEIFKAILCRKYFMTVGSLTYNGHRCKLVKWNLWYSLIQDEEKKTFYYPTEDLHGLIPLFNCEAKQLLLVVYAKRFLYIGRVDERVSLIKGALQSTTLNTLNCGIAKNKRILKRHAIETGKDFMVTISSLLDDTNTPNADFTPLRTSCIWIRIKAKAKARLRLALAMERRVIGSGLAGNVTEAGPTASVRPIPDDSINKLKRQMQASQVSAAHTASPLPTPLLHSVSMPRIGGLVTGPGSDTLAELLRLTQDSPQPLLDAKVGDTYRRTIPSSLPLGMDLALVVQERERLLQERAEKRIQALERLLTGMDGPERTKYMIELKTLKLAAVQRQLRENVLRVAHQLRCVDTYGDRPGLRRNKKQSLREARLTERNEQNQKKDRSRKERQSYFDHLQAVVSHHRDLQSIWRSASQKRTRLVKQVMHHHGNFEKEDQRRQERTQKDRLRALKMDDEEAYLKLLDQEKDTRLTYLLKQTDEFLGGLAAKVAAQQEDTQRKLTLDGSASASPVSSESDLGTDEVIKVDYFSTAHKKKEVVEEQPKNLVGGKLKDYQIKGLQWMVSLYNNHLNGILADEMGLGKTIQAISLISYLIEKKGQNGPYLIIVPLSTMTNWVMEFEKWAPSVSKIEYKGVPSQRKNLQNQLKHGRFNVLLTTYEYVIKDRPFLSKIRWLYLVVDEGHRMKNSHSKLTTVLTQYYQMRYRLILTGTPLQNNLPELWALLNFLLPHVFNSCKSFEEWFNTPFANTGEKMELNEEEILLIIRRLHKVLRPFLLRRMKKDVEAELPDKVELVLKCPMSALQQTLYNTVTKRSASALRDPKSLGIRRLNNTIMQLRKICNHPFVFSEVEQQMNPNHQNNELLYRVAGKFELLKRILPKFQATGHKLLIFFQMTQIMTIMEDMLTMQGYKYLRLDGSTKADDRTDLLKRFNAPDSPYFIFLLSTRAGGLGLNLQSADTVIIFDSDWNPHQDLQAQDRAHRIGQTKEVRILRLITIESVEEYIFERAQHKLSLDGKIIQAGKFDHKSTNEERDEMLRAIMEREAEKNDVEEIYGDDELNEIIARDDAELEEFRKMDEEQEQRPLGRLIESHELPKVYLLAEEDEGVVEEDEFADLRSSRRRDVTYNDNLTDDQWLAQIERGETPSSTTSSARKSRKRATDMSASESESLSSPQRTQRIKLKLGKRSKDDGLDADARLNILRAIYDVVENCLEEETNRYRSDLFLQLPERDQYPDYYQLITDPISLAEIEQKISDYASVDAFMEDLEKMFGNAMRYNVEGSQVYEDAQMMKQLATDKLAELLVSEGRFHSDDDI